jgi:energy-coupling factor transport system ATP-binding protein
MISLSDVGHVYGARSPWAHRALRAVDLEITAGERMLIAGPNGSGKSTLAWILAGLIEPTEGTAVIDRQPLAGAGGDVVIAFQYARLQLFRPTVGEDIRYGTDLDAADVAVALALVGLSPAFAGRRVDDLSGGEQRRVVLAALLARRPRLMVLDEPLAGLDVPSRRSLVDLLSRLPSLTGTALVTVSHDLDEAHLIADRLVLLDGGTVTSDGPLPVTAAGGA